MNAGKWFELRREYDPEALPYSWPKTTRRMWKERVKERAGRGIRKTFEGMKRDLEKIDPSPAIFVIFPGEYSMSGHLASIRRAWENMQLINFECWKTGVPMRTRGRYFGTSGVVIWTKYTLGKLAELSPVFAPIWEDLKDMSAEKCGIYLADTPSMAWLESIQPDERSLFEEFRESRHLDMIGLDLDVLQEALLEEHGSARSLLMEKRYEDGEAILEEVLARHPNDWRAYWDLAMSAIRQGDPYKCSSVIRRALKRFPDALNFDRLGVDCCIKLNEWDAAERHLKRLWGLNPWDPNLMMRYAGVAFGRDEFALSAGLYRDCMECGTLSFAAQMEYGVALSKIDRCKEALAVFRDMEKQEPANPGLLNNIGFVLASVGRAAEGLRYCQKALELAPEREYIWDSLGFVQLKTKNYPEATRSFLKAVDLNPTFPDAWRHLLHVYHKEGKADRLEGAKAYVARVLPDQLARFEREKGLEILD